MQAQQTYNHQLYQTMATINSTVFGFIKTITVAPDKLRITTANTSGTLTDMSFTFVVYKK
jgi:hypothetical protein